MQGLLVLGGRPDCFFGNSQLQNFKILYENAAETDDPPLFLSRAQLLLSRLMHRCDWVCVLSEDDLLACALILAEQYPVDRLILMGGSAFQKHSPDRRRRRLDAFARRNLSLITAEIIAAGMDERALKQLSSGLGWHGKLLYLPDAAELWRKRETFLTAPFEALSELPEPRK